MNGGAASASDETAAAYVSLDKWVHVPPRGVVHHQSVQGQGEVHGVGQLRGYDSKYDLNLLVCISHILYANCCPNMVRYIDIFPSQTRNIDTLGPTVRYKA